MTRRPARNTRPSARWLPWTPELAAKFRLTKATGWTPPTHARLTGGLHRMTLSAKFIDADGSQLIAKLRLVRDHADGAVYIAGEELQLPTLILRKEEA